MPVAAVPVKVTAVPMTTEGMIARWRRLSTHFKAFSNKYTVEKLSGATNGWASSCFLARGGFGAVYKGTLDGSEVAIKAIMDIKAYLPGSGSDH